MPTSSRLTDVLAELDMLMEQGIQERAFPGAALWVGWHGETLKCSAYGKTADQAYEQYEPAPVVTNTLYDLASLTKGVATTTAILQLIEQGRLQLDDLICTYLPQFGCDAQKATITVQHVLTHTSGLPGPCRLYQHCHGPDQIIAGICQQELVFPPGTQYLYNDLGFILLGEVLRTITSLNLDEYTCRHIFEPLGMHDTLFTPPTTLKPRIAPTEYVAWRGGLVHGVVHDEKTTIHVPDPDEAHGLGWVIAAPYFMGRLASDSTFGHTGFTGTSLLIDPKRQLAVVFLSNCVCPQRGFNLNPYRRGIANALAKLFDP